MEIRKQKVRRRIQQQVVVPQKEETAKEVQQEPSGSDGSGDKDPGLPISDGQHSDLFDPQSKDDNLPMF